jgi:hypothetical protein
MHAKAARSHFTAVPLSGHALNPVRAGQGLSSAMSTRIRSSWSLEGRGGIDMLVNNAGMGMRTVNRIHAQRPGLLTAPPGPWCVVMTDIAY